MTALSSPSPYIQSFINNSWYHRYEESPPARTVTMIWSLIVSLFAVGGLFGAVSVKLISGMLGRKKTMICSSLINTVAAGIMLMSRLASSYEMIIVARILFGYSAGLGSSTHLMYLGEISPRKIRGVVTLSSSTFASLGKLSGQFFGLSEILGHEELWSVVLSISAVFSIVNVIVLPFLPEAPRYLLIEKGDDKGCKKALQTLWGKGDYKEEMDEMLAEQVAVEVAPPKSTLQLLRDRTVRWQFITMFLISGCNQLSGMSAINIFSFDIFLKIGIPKDKIRYMTLGLGATEIVTLVSCGFLIEILGRRPLFWGGYGFMSACWILATVTMNLQNTSYWVPYITCGLIVLFIIFFYGGPVGTSTALNNEVFIQSDRAAALVLLGIQRWVMFALLGLVFPFLLSALNSYCFVLFACVCLLGCAYTFFFLPETKGKSLLVISEEFKAITLCGKSFLEKNTEEHVKGVETRL